ncbi:hypothetical protein GCM10009080_34910 [Cupriavidus pauculus]
MYRPQVGAFEVRGLGYLQPSVRVLMGSDVALSDAIEFAGSCAPSYVLLIQPAVSTALPTNVPATRSNGIPYLRLSVARTPARPAGPVIHAPMRTATTRAWCLAPEDAPTGYQRVNPGWLGSLP